MRAINMLGIPLVFVYCLITWGVLYPAMLVIRNKVGLFVSPFLVAAPASVLLAFLFHRPEVDGDFINTLSVFGAWLFVPWYVGGLAASCLWPNTRIQVTPKSGAPNA